MRPRLEPKIVSINHSTSPSKRATGFSLSLKSASLKLIQRSPITEGELSTKQSSQVAYVFFSFFQNQSVKYRTFSS